MILGEWEGERSRTEVEWTQSLNSILGQRLRAGKMGCKMGPQLFACFLEFGTPGSQEGKTL